MKASILIGTMLGVVTATIIYNAMEEKPAKKTKKMIVDKIEDMLNL